MHTLIVPVRGKMTYAVAPSAAQVAAFTKAKGHVWGQAGASIDGFIDNKICEFIRKVSAPNRAHVRAVLGVQWRANLTKRIYNQVNFGLAVIAHTPDVEIKGNPPYTIVDRQIFEGAMSRLLKAHYGYTQRSNRERVAASIVWVDTCAFQLLEASLDGLI